MDFDYIGSYQIKSRLDYFTLKDMAQEKLFSVSDRWSKLILEGIAVIIFGLLQIYVSISILDGFRLTTAILYMSAVVGFYIDIFGVMMVFRGGKKLKSAINDYYGDLRKIQEKLTWSDIYMDIPEADLEEFDSAYKLFSFSVKSILKNILERIMKKA